MKTRNTMAPSYHSKVISNRNLGFHFSLVWVMEFIIISSCLRMWQDKNTQLKAFCAAPQYFIIILHLQQRFKASLILHGGAIPVKPSKNWVNTISIHLIKKKFPVFQVIDYWSTRKIMLSSQYYRWLLNKYSRH